MAITKPPITAPFASDPTTQADPDLFAAPSFMVQGYTAPGGNPEIPALGHFNWLFWFLAQSARYHQSRGLPEWDTNETEYVAPAFVSYGGRVWMLTGSPTTGLAPAADLANWMPFGQRGPWGYSASNAVISADTSLILGHAYYHDLTINAGKTLTMVHPGWIYVSGTLTIANTGKIVFGDSGLNGANASTSTRGFAGVGWNADSFGQVLGGSSGGAGGDDTHISPGAGDPVGGLGATGWGGGGSALGGAGGAGGNGAHAGAAAGTLYSFFSGTAETEAQALLTILKAGGWGFARSGTSSARVPVMFGLEGGAAGGGGGGANAPGNSAGGGSGAGGCVGVVFANNVVIAADGCIQAPGGNGGNAFAGSVAAGGGGPGGGGFVGLVYGTKSGPALTAAACCPAGTPGTGANGGAAGAAAAVGNVREYQIGV